jgi:hypothetical protein
LLGQQRADIVVKVIFTADQNFSSPLMRFADKYVRDLVSSRDKLTGGFANGLGATLISESW